MLRIATVLLIIDGQPLSPLTAVYPVLIAASGLWSNVRVVAFTTALAMIGYVVLIAESWAKGKPIGFRYAHIDFIAALALIAAHQVRRVRAGKLDRWRRTRLLNEHAIRTAESPLIQEVRRPVKPVVVLHVNLAVGDRCAGAWEIPTGRQPAASWKLQRRALCRVACGFTINVFSTEVEAATAALASWGRFYTSLIRHFLFRARARGSRRIRSHGL